MCPKKQVFVKKKRKFSAKFRAFSEKRKGKQGNWRYQEPQAPKPTLNSEETKALKELRNDQNLVISKADKGNTTVVMDKTDYDMRLLTMLEDNTTYQQLQKDPTPNTEKTVNEFVFQLVADNKITKIQSCRLKSSNGRAPVLYGLPKLHKKIPRYDPWYLSLALRLTIYQKTWHEFLVS